ncbi:MAG: TrkA family potassium uptake protein [Oscillospiraceae bacterium]
MNILVVGGGHLGRKVAEELDREGHEVSLIEEDEDKLSLLSPKFGGVTFLSFPMDIENLRNAGIESCDAVAVTTSDDNLNITVGQIAKSIFKVNTVVARISDPFREYIFESFGLQTVCPTNMAGDSITTAITSPYEPRKLTFGTNMVSFRVKAVDKRNVDKRLSDILGSEGEMPFGIIGQDGKLMLSTPYNPTTLKLGDSVVFAKKID